MGAFWLSAEFFGFEETFQAFTRRYAVPIVASIAIYLFWCYVTFDAAQSKHKAEYQKRLEGASRRRRK